MVTRQRKEDIVANLRARAQGASVAFVATHNKMSVEDFTQLRRNLKGDAECVVVKNTLARLALQDSEFANISPFLQGTSLLVLGRNEDAAQTIKAFQSLQKKLKSKLELKGGVLADDPAPLDAQTLDEIGKLPPKEVLMAGIAGSLTATPGALVQTINQIIGGIGELAVKVAEQKQPTA